MCSEIIKKSPTTYIKALLYLLMIGLGIFSGLSGIEILENLGLLISDIFIRIFKCISLPIITLSIIVALSSHDSQKSMRGIWQRTIFYTISTTIIAASLSFLFYLLIKPKNVLSVLQSTDIEATTSKISYLKHLANQIPQNILSPFLEHQVIGVLMIGIIIGIAIRYIPQDTPKNLMINFFQGIYAIFLTITRWVVAIIPLALYGFITATTIELKKGINIEGIGQYLLVIVAANLTQGLLILPTWLKLNKISPIEAAKGMSKALSIAFFSKSSAGTLPITIECAESNLKVSSKISRFVLPLCTTINMNGCAAFIFATVIYLMQNNGMEINIGTMLLWIIISTIAAVGNAGVPMGCFFLSASLLVSMNIPITLMGVILPFYTIIDMIETALNVWSDSCVAKVVNEKNSQITN